MRTHILLLTLVAMISSCNGESELQQLPLIGEWKQTQYGKIIDGDFEMNPYLGIHTVTFGNGTGREYYSEDHQLSFEWSLSDDQLTTTSRRFETDIIVDYDYLRSKVWTVLQLGSDELIVSCWMSVAFPDSGLQPYDAVMTFERVK